MRIATVLLAAMALAGTAPAQTADYSSITNFLRVNEQICTGGQPSLEDLTKMKAEGIRAIINLRRASEYKHEEEAARAGELGLRYIHIPVDGANPQDSQAAEFLRATSDPENRPAFIHCAAANRVGAFWMIRRMLVDQWPLEEAETEARKIGLRSPALREFAVGYVARQQSDARLTSIRNFLRINSDFCTGGQPRPEHLEKLKAAGVRAIINLRTPGEHRADEEEAQAKQLGLRYLNIPVVFTAPKDEQVDEFLRITDDTANRPAFIHCTAAIRVGGFWMIRRVLRDGWTLEAAEAEAAQIGLRQSPHFLDFARAYIAKNKK
jgi:uncharacterized protein (TIGR01244 family)